MCVSLYLYLALESVKKDNFSTLLNSDGVMGSWSGVQSQGISHQSRAHVQSVITFRHHKYFTVVEVRNTILYYTKLLSETVTHYDL